MVFPGTLVEFREPERSLENLDATTAARVITAAADVALVMDGVGVIHDFAFTGIDSALLDVSSWVGRPWVETVARDSRAKVEEMLQDSANVPVVRAREINHPTAVGSTLPIRYSAVRLHDTERVLAFGRDLRAIANLQQQLVDSQQTMEREYARLRHAETRYRLLFQVASEAVLVVDAAALKIVEANPAAGEMLEESPRKLTNRRLSNLFSESEWLEVQSLLDKVRIAGWADEITTQLPNDRRVDVSASLFRQEKTPLFLVRLASGLEPSIASLHGRKASRLLGVVEGLPDGFVVTDGDFSILMTNGAFLDMAQLATEQQARGESLDKWLGRPGVDLDIISANLREHGAVRNFSTVVRGQYGSVEQAEVSAVSSETGGQITVGLVIRPVTARSSMDAATGLELPRSLDQIVGMVGRVPLKEIVRETTDVIERLCIEAALDVSGDNRASAAQVLGLSRQSLYAKLRRHGLGDLENGDDTP